MASSGSDLSRSSEYLYRVPGADARRTRCEHKQSTSLPNIAYRDLVRNPFISYLGNGTIQIGQEVSLSGEYDPLVDFLC
jgi:hypothetical protein